MDLIHPLRAEELQLLAQLRRARQGLRAKPLAMAVNLCTPNFAGGLAGNLQGPLVPFDNAFFSGHPSCIGAPRR